MPTACILIIGNEILSGRTRDSNGAWLAEQLAPMGIALEEIRVIPDDEARIVEAVNACRARHTYLFTTGGIGPTHDDITTAAIAKAFGRKIVRHPEAERRLRAHYPPEMRNAARLKMADLPEGAELIDNPVSAAPGFILGNVYVMAGVPAIMQAMFDGIRHRLKGGAPVRSRTLSAHVTEGFIAEELAEIQRRHATVEIGSYPFMHRQKLGVSIVLRAADTNALDDAARDVHALLSRFAEVMEGGFEKA
jgi:molybdenum cofactor synthesis domain-containing protein